MDSRLSQSIYSLFRSSREVGRICRTRSCAEHTTKPRRGSFTPRRFGSSSTPGQRVGSARKTDRRSICNTNIVGDRNSSVAIKQIDIQPKVTTRLQSSFTRGTSVKTNVLYNFQACQPRVRPSSQNGPIRSVSSSVSTATSGKPTGYEGIKDPSDITQNKYNQLADDYLEAVQQWLEDLSDADENVEVEFSVSESPSEMFDTLVAAAGTYDLGYGCQC